MRLLQTAELAHVHVDWRLPGEWLGEPAFFVFEQAGETGRRQAFFGNPRPPMDAVLCVAADPPPAAWVRIAGARQTKQLELLEQMIRVAIDTLTPEVDEIAWFVTDSWPTTWLEEMGFGVADEVMAYRKRDFVVPEVQTVAGLTLRPAAPAEMDELAEIEALAFEARWRHSAESLAMARAQSLSFDVAELDGRLVGFQFSTRSQDGAHLARMTIRPEWQGQGIGGALLAEALAAYHAAGCSHATLNTQRTNAPSRKLYARFGFEPTGQQFPVWSLAL